MKTKLQKRKVTSRTARMIALTFAITSFYNVNADTITFSDQTTTYTGNPRGYFFTAPEAFQINSAWAADDTYVSGYQQDIMIVRFNSTPAVYSATTTDYTVLGRWMNVSDMTISTGGINVSANDIIGVIGGWHAVGGTQYYNSYGDGSLPATLNGNIMDISRLIFQGGILPETPELSDEGTSGSINRIFISTTVIPEPATLGMVGLVSGGLFFIRRTFMI